MPNGYTAPINDGEDFTLRDYLVRVGKSFGFAYHHRDGNLDDEITEIKLDTTYHNTELAKSAERLRFILDLRDDQCEAFAKNEAKENESNRIKIDADNKARATRYDAMIAGVQNWIPGPIISTITLKDTALKYLTESKEWDCAGSDSESLDRYYPLKPLDARAWRNREIESAQKNIEYHLEARDKDIDRVTEFNEAIREFNSYLPAADDAQTSS